MQTLRGQREEWKKEANRELRETVAVHPYLDIHWNKVKERSRLVVCTWRSRARCASARLAKRISSCFFFFPSFLRAVSSHEIQLCRDRNFHLRRARRKFRSHPQTRILSDRSALISALCFRFRAGRGVVHAEQRQQPRLPQHDRAEY